MYHLPTGSDHFNQYPSSQAGVAPATASASNAATGSVGSVCSVGSVGSVGGSVPQHLAGVAQWPPHVWVGPNAIRVQCNPCQLHSHRQFKLWADQMVYSFLPPGYGMVFILGARNVWFQQMPPPHMRGGPPPQQCGPQFQPQMRGPSPQPQLSEPVAAESPVAVVPESTATAVVAASSPEKVERSKPVDFPALSDFKGGGGAAGTLSYSKMTKSKPSKPSPSGDVVVGVAPSKKQAPKTRKTKAKSQTAPKTSKPSTPPAQVSGEVATQVRQVSGKLSFEFGVTLPPQTWKGEKNSTIAVAKMKCRKFTGITVSDGDAKTKGVIAIRCKNKARLEKYRTSLLEEPLKFSMTLSCSLQVISSVVGKVIAPLKKEWTVEAYTQNATSSKDATTVPCRVSLGAIAKFCVAFEEQTKSTMTAGEQDSVADVKVEYVVDSFACEDLAHARRVSKAACLVAGDIRTKHGISVSVTPEQDKTLKSGRSVKGDGHMDKDGSFRVAFSMPAEFVEDFKEDVLERVADGDKEYQKRVEKAQNKQKFTDAAEYSVPTEQFKLWGYPVLKKATKKEGVEFLLCGKRDVEGVSHTVFKLMGSNEMILGKVAKKVKTTLESISTGESKIATIPTQFSHEALQELSQWMNEKKEVDLPGGGKKMVNKHHNLRFSQQVKVQATQTVAITASGEMRSALHWCPVLPEETERVAFVMSTEDGSTKSYLDRVIAAQKKLYKEQMPLGWFICDKFPSRKWDEEHKRLYDIVSWFGGKWVDKCIPRFHELDRVKEEKAAALKASKDRLLEEEKSREEAAKEAFEKRQREFEETNAKSHQVVKRDTYDNPLTLSKSKEEVTPKPSTDEGLAHAPALAVGEPQPVEQVTPGKKAKKAKRSRGKRLDVAIGCASHKTQTW